MGLLLSFSMQAAIAVLLVMSASVIGFKSIRVNSVKNSIVAFRYNPCHANEVSKLLPNLLFAFLFFSSLASYEISFRK